MTQTEIREQNTALTQELKEARAHVADVQTRMRALFTKCSHPDKYEYSVMGELGWKCPDCGWAN